MKRNITRRGLLRHGAFISGAVFAGFVRAPWVDAAAICQAAEQREAFLRGKQVGTVDFIHEGPVDLDTPLGAELEGRLYTDLAALTPSNSVTSTEKFYVRTRASQLLPDTDTWSVKVAGMAGRSMTLPLSELRKLAKPQGVRVMECAGNVRLARFGMISAANWTGVSLSDILESSKPTPGATRALISGFDRYATESTTSIAGASWVFSLEEVKAAGAFLATEMNAQPLTRDHGAPVRLLMPGWYGCCCIKWVESITLVDDRAEATSQMLEYAARTMQHGMPKLAREYQPAVIDTAAMPVRVEKWLLQGQIKYRVVGIVWGGTRPVKNLQIRFNPEEDYVPVDRVGEATDRSWTLWTHAWSPKVPGTYTIRMAVKDPAVQTRRLDSGYYARTVEISEI